MTMLWNGLGVLLCGLIAILLLRESRREFVPYILLTLCILVWLTLLPVLSESVTWIQAIISGSRGGNRFGTVLLKALGISMLTELGCEICRSVGEAGLAGYVALVGKGELLVLTLPLLQDFAALAMEFAV